MSEPLAERPPAPVDAGTTFSGGDLIMLWVGVLAPPASWIVDLLGQYFVLRWANQHGRVWPFWAITGATVATCAGGAALSWVARRRARAAQRMDHATLADWGMAMAAYFSLLIAAQAYPVWALDVRELT